MKNYHFLTLSLMLVFSISNVFAQKENEGKKTSVPAAVKAAFKAKFPTATAVKWEKESANEFEAEAKMAGAEFSANFNEKGEWLEIETEIAAIALPEAVLKTFHANYGEATLVKEAAKIEKNNGSILYEIEFKKDGKRMEILFEANGTERK